MVIITMLIYIKKIEREETKKRNATILILLLIRYIYVLIFRYLFAVIWQKCIDSVKIYEFKIRNINQEQSWNGFALSQSGEFPPGHAARIISFKNKTKMRKRK